MNANKVDDNLVIQESNNLNEIENTLLETLSVEESFVIEKVRSAFVLVFQHDPSQCSFAHITDHISALITWSQIGNQLALQFISFFRHIEEFEKLHPDDRFILIKYNLFSLFPLYKCFNSHLLIDWNLLKGNEEEENVDEEQNNHDCSFNNTSSKLQPLFFTLLRTLVELAEEDPIFLPFLLVIFVFSQSLSMCEDDISLNDPLAVARAQSYYIQILWSYMKIKRGETKTNKQFIQLLTTIFQIQSAEKRIRDHIRAKLTWTNSLNIIGPLMQTVLHVS